jgi:hypothetical protein
LIIADGWSVESLRDDPFLQGVLRRRTQNDVVSAGQNIASTAVCMARDRAFLRGIWCVCPRISPQSGYAPLSANDVMRSKGA